MQRSACHLHRPQFVVEFASEIHTARMNCHVSRVGVVTIEYEIAKIEIRNYVSMIDDPSAIPTVPSNPRIVIVGSIVKVDPVSEYKTPPSKEISPLPPKV